MACECSARLQSLSTVSFFFWIGRRVRDGWSGRRATHELDAPVIFVRAASRKQASAKRTSSCSIAITSAGWTLIRLAIDTC